MTRLATVRVYRNAAGDYCTEDDPTVAFLVCGVGAPLPDDYPTAEKAEPEPVAEKVTEAPTPKKKRA